MNEHALHAPPVLIIACGAVAHELMSVIRANHWHNCTVQCLPAELHNRPERIPARVRAKIRAAGTGYARVFVAYADCGTGGQLDRVLREEGAERLPGAHCYEFFAGSDVFSQLAVEEPGTLYLTDFLARNFERLMIRGLGIDRHPELEAMLFGNYRRLVYLAQTEQPELTSRAQAAARRLGLSFERRYTGYGELARRLVAFDPAASGAATPV